MLALDCRGMTLGVFGTMDDLFVSELFTLGGQCPLCGVVVPVVIVSMLDRPDFVLVLLGEDFLIMNWLYSTVIMILVDFLIHSGVDLLVFPWLDGLLLNGWLNRFMYGSFMVTRIADEVTDYFLSLVHIE